MRTPINAPLNALGGRIPAVRIETVIGETRTVDGRSGVVAATLLHRRSR